MPKSNWECGLIRTYKGLYEKRKPPMQTIVYDSARTVPNLEYGIYYIDPEACDALHPKDDNKYGNALSVVFYFRHGSHAILFPGDMTPEGMAHILANGKGVQKRFSPFEKEFAQKHPGWHEETGSQPTLKELLGRSTVVLEPPLNRFSPPVPNPRQHVMPGGRSRPRLSPASEARGRLKWITTAE